MLETIVVYGLVPVFFIAVIAVVFFVIAPNNDVLADQKQNNVNIQLDGRQNNALNYSIIALLFLLLIAFTFVARREQPAS